MVDNILHNCYCTTGWLLLKIIQCIKPVCKVAEYSFQSFSVVYSRVPHNDVSVNDGPHIRRWSLNIIILTIVLQLPTVFSTVTCCTGL